MKVEFSVRSLRYLSVDFAKKDKKLNNINDITIQPTQYKYNITINTLVCIHKCLFHIFLYKDKEGFEYSPWKRQQNIDFLSEN